MKQRHGEKLKDNSIVFKLLQNSKTTEKMLENLEDRTKKGKLKKEVKGF
jgi:hypothetical protein